MTSKCLYEVTIYIPGEPGHSVTFKVVAPNIGVCLAKVQKDNEGATVNSVDFLSMCYE